MLFKILFAQIFQSLFLLLGNVSSFLDKSSNFHIFLGGRIIGFECIFLLLLFHLLLLACIPSRLLCMTSCSNHSLFFLVHVVSDMSHDRTYLLVHLRAIFRKFFICFSHRLCSSRSQRVLYPFLWLPLPFSHFAWLLLFRRFFFALTQFHICGFSFFFDFFNELLVSCFELRLLFASLIPSVIFVVPDFVFFSITRAILLWRGDHECCHDICGRCPCGSCRWLRRLCCISSVFS